MKPENLESVYRLSPTQEGILFHSLAEPQGDLYFLQIACVLRGELNAPAFRRSWDSVVARHPALRTAFQWEELEKPVQVVSRRVELPWREEDWRGLETSEQERRWGALLRADRERGLDLSTAPLLRLALVRLADGVHRCLWSGHHIVLDGWCLPVMFQEAFSIYASLCQGTEPRLEPVRPYRDYIAWLQRRDLAAAEGFWRGYLAGLSSPTLLGVDRAPAGPPGGSRGHERRESHLGESATAALVALARRRQLTLSTVLQGAWGLLLHSYSGEDDVVFGAVFSGRSAPLPGIESMIGPFINTLPVRVRVPAEASAGAWLQELQESHLRMLEHESTPLVQVQGWSGIPRGLPLFESLLAFENYPIDPAARELDLPLAVETLQAVTGSHYPLGLAVFEGERLALRVDYDPGRFDAVTAGRLLGHLGRLLEQLAADPDRRLAELSPLTEAERHQVLREWRGRGEPAGGEPGLAERLAIGASPDPSAPAVVWAGGSASFAEIDARAGTLARRLRSLGAGPETVVALCLDRSPELVVAALGILRSGGAYLPLDPEHPAERLDFMVKDAGARLAVTRVGLLERLPAGLAAICLDQEENGPAGDGEAAAAPVDACAANLAYVIYTSGSTGRPKGVAVSRGAVAALGHAFERLVPAAERRRVSLNAPLSFDPSVPQLLAVPGGGTLVIVPEEVRRDGAELLRFLREQRVDLFDCTPSQLRLMVEEGLDRWDSVWPRRLLVAGEAVEAPLWQRLAGDGARRYDNVYGPTEGTVYATSRPIEEGSPQPSIGRAMGHSRTHVLDAGQEAVPAGVPGELCLGGPGLARGYVGRPAETAERFVPDPFGTTPGGRLYRTGDRVRWRADGEIEFLGRLDRQVKIRGVRVELGEVESALERHPAVRRAAVVLRRDGAAEPRLVAYLAAAEGGDLAAAGLRDFLAGILPAPLIPAVFMALGDLPLTPGGKIDRRALPLPDAGRLGARSRVEPRGEVEQALAGIWSELLGVERVDAGDSFFDLGGHSLLITRVRSRVQAAFGVELPIGELFANPVLSGMAAAIERAKRAGGAPGRLELTPIPRQRHSMRRGDLRSGGQS
jgi:amino acid adenylation domain-containing protein